MQMVSDCCAAPVRVVGDVTQYWICNDCKRPCDAVPPTEVKHE